MPDIYSTLENETTTQPRNIGAQTPSEKRTISQKEDLKRRPSVTEDTRKFQLSNFIFPKMRDVMNAHNFFPPLITNHSTRYSMS
jgi:hypothetical protein